jgi:hypothetical protein
MNEPLDPPARAWIPYVAPMAVFLGLTMIEGYLPKGGEGGPHPTWYPAFYAAKIAAVAVAMVWGRSAWRDLKARPGVGGWLLAVGVGLVVAAMWVGLDGLYPKFGASDARASFDPYTLRRPLVSGSWPSACWGWS